MPEGVSHYKGFQRGYDGYATVVHGLILGITTSYFKKMIEAKTYYKLALYTRYY